MNVFIISFLVSFLIAVLTISISLYLGRIVNKRKLNNSDSEWHKLHYQMWDWLSKHPDATKFYWLEKHPKYRELAGIHNCFACEQARRVLSKASPSSPTVRCNYCPFKTRAEGVPLDNINIDEMCLDGLWMKWKHSSGKEKSRVAKQIRDFSLHK